MKEQGLIAFVADGAILPRESGISSKTYEACSCLSLTGFHESAYGSFRTRERLPAGAKSRNYVDCRRWLSWKVYLLKALEMGVHPHISATVEICGDRRRL